MMRPKTERAQRAVVVKGSEAGSEVVLRCCCRFYSDKQLAGLRQPTVPEGYSTALEGPPLSRERKKKAGNVRSAARDKRSHRTLSETTATTTRYDAAPPK